MGAKEDYVLALAAGFSAAGDVMKARVTEYAAGVQNAIDEHMKQYENINIVPKVEIEFCPRYVKIWKRDGINQTSRSIHTFIDRRNGDILKAASYKAPQKNGVRGNIFADDYGLSCVNWHGAIYLR